MTEILAKINKFISLTNEKQLSNITEDPSCKEYFGCSFQAGELHIIFRKAKTTPKKAGLFVTLWKRNAVNETEPYHADDPFDFYVVMTEQEDESGCFIFPKQILVEKQILTEKGKEGKRGFRVYPAWVQASSNQAKNTQRWQNEYFINSRT